MSCRSAQPGQVLCGTDVLKRDGFKQRAFPDDDYDLTPASLADIDPALGDLGIVWGAWKAMAHKTRHGGPR